MVLPLHIRKHGKEGPCYFYFVQLPRFWDHQQLVGSTLDEVCCRRCLIQESGPRSSAEILNIIFAPGSPCDKEHRCRILCFQSAFPWLSGFKIVKSVVSRRLQKQEMYNILAALSFIFILKTKKSYGWQTRNCDTSYLVREISWKQTSGPVFEIRGIQTNNWNSKPETKQIYMDKSQKYSNFIMKQREHTRYCNASEHTSNLSTNTVGLNQ